MSLIRSRSYFAFAPNKKEIRRYHMGWCNIDAEITMYQSVISVSFKQTRFNGDGREHSIPLKGTKCFDVLWSKVTNAALNEKDNEPEMLAVTGENCDETVFDRIGEDMYKLSIDSFKSGTKEIVAFIEIENIIDFWQLLREVREEILIIKS